MHAWESIQKTLEVIEQRIGEELSTEELANEAALSLFYYQRLFTRLVRKPVKEYIKLRRLDRACEALRGTSKRIVDIALDYGFSSHESFTRAFKDVYGLNPTEYKQSDVRLNSFVKPDLKLNYTMIDLGVPLISEGVVLELNRITLDTPICFIGLMEYVSIAGLFPSGEVMGVNEPGEVWQRFGEIEANLPSKPMSRKIGVAYHDTSAPEGSFPYFVGAEAEPQTDNGGFQTWTLPVGEYLVMRFEAESFDELVSSTLPKALKYQHMWQREKGLKLGSFGAEIYYNVSDEQASDFAFMEIWALWLE
jgi:AraC family transcriptional regulator